MITLSCPWFAVGAENQVEHLITTIAEKDAVGIHTLDDCDALLQCALQRVGIAVHTRLEWTFVGIKKDGRIALKLIFGRGVGFELGDGGTD
jgi:hypothetical protein